MENIGNWIESFLSFPAIKYITHFPLSEADSGPGQISNTLCVLMGGHVVDCLLKGLLSTGAEQKVKQSKTKSIKKHHGGNEKVWTMLFFLFGYYTPG